MAYTLTVSAALGAANAGKTVRARLATWNAGSGGYITGDVIETPVPAHRGGGNFLWTYNAFDEDFQGGVEFVEYDPVTPAVLGVLAVAPVNSQESAPLNQVLAELTDVPAATPSVAEALMLLYMGLRNRMDTRTGALLFYPDSEAGGSFAYSVLTDTGTELRRGKMQDGTPP
jgi:hypothetical protein